MFAAAIPAATVRAYRLAGRRERLPTGAGAARRMPNPASGSCSIAGCARYPPCAAIVIGAQDERHGRIHAAQGLGLEQAERRQVREHQPPDLGSDARQGIAGRQASAAALLAGHAERRQGHGHARRAAGGRAQGRGIRRLADPHRRGRPVRQRLCRDQPEFEDPGAGRPQRSDADPGVRDRLRS